MRAGVGFYWTLPVPWAGFTSLPEDIDAAAEASRTIRYQRTLIRGFAKGDKIDLIDEKVFLEIAPDRGSRHIRDALRPVSAICRDRGALLLYVDFSAAQGWRSHGPMADILEAMDVESFPLAPSEVLLDGTLFDPSRHFAEWRDRHQAWTDGKAERLAAARAEARRLQTEEGANNTAIALRLNDRGFRSATGKPWTAETVRKQLR